MRKNWKNKIARECPPNWNKGKKREAIKNLLFFLYSEKNKREKKKSKEKQRKEEEKKKWRKNIESESQGVTEYDAL